jgi:hypothetical protein
MAQLLMLLLGRWAWRLNRLRLLDWRRLYRLPHRRFWLRRALLNGFAIERLLKDLSCRLLCRCYNWRCNGSRRRRRRRYTVLLRLVRREFFVPWQVIELAKLVLEPGSRTGTRTIIWRKRGWLMTRHVLGLPRSQRQRNRGHPAPVLDADSCTGMVRI